MSIRTAHAGDIMAVDALLARSYPRLLKEDYPPSTLVLALPLISRAQPALMNSGTYYVVEDPNGTVIAAGGWTRRGPNGAQTPSTGHIRHVATDPDYLHRGHARRVLHHIIEDARAAGVTRLACLSTLTAVPFYMRLGFQRLRAETIVLRPGITFDTVSMQRPL